jgi:hypothetical protein
MQEMTVRIEGRGDPRSWKFSNAATGEPLRPIDVRLAANPRESQVTLWLYKTEIDVVTKVRVITVCRGCRFKNRLARWWWGLRNRLPHNASV